jgi:UDP-N-acetylmuramoyl-L-alanyl-D-glutamate--2,6-diaminopimelate ligase
MINQLTLQQLVDNFCCLSTTEPLSLMVSNLELDSRKITKNDTFVAIIGHAVDGRKFIDNAIRSGAHSVLAQAESKAENGNVELRNGAVIVYLYQLDLHLSAIAKKLYAYGNNTVIGVTGTNGKTTISQLIAQWLELMSMPSAIMGTNGNGFLNDLKQAANTTANAVDVQKILAELADLGARYTAMEVSSHGLVQGRVAKVPFRVGVFTNLSRDHLDYHGTMEGYAAAKQLLFTEHHCEYAVLNIDDVVSQSWLESRSDAITVSALGDTNASLWAQNIQYSESGITIEYDGVYGSGTLQAPLIGQFNATNLMLAFATLLTLGFEPQGLQQVAVQLQPVIGRMELFKAAGKPKVVVDYAHTPDALEKALQALRVHCTGKLWVIVGCGGDRDTGKRPMMAEIAERLADEVILSDDNPRSEDPQQIVSDMLKGMNNPHAAHVLHSRYQAAKFAVEKATEQDIILLAGKGHEDYQVIGTQSVHYSDRESAAQLLGEAL